MNPPPFEEAHVLSTSENLCSRADLTGGKASSLAMLTSIAAYLNNGDGKVRFSSSG